MTSFIGIDVGLSGGIAATTVAPDPELRALIRLYPMPTLTSVRNRKLVQELNGPELVRIFRDELSAQVATFVLIEKPQMRPAVWRDKQTGELKVNQGALSQARFLGQGERIKGILEGLGIPFEEIAPATWKKDVFRGQGGADKDAARLKAMQMWPELADRFKLKKSDGIAEALLLAWYCQRRHGTGSDLRAARS